MAAKNRSKSRSKQQYQVALLTFAGLADITLKATDGIKGRVLKLPNHDLILLSSYEERALRQTSLIEDSFMLLGKPLTIRSTKDLEALGQTVTEAGILAAIDLKKRLFPGRGVKRVTFNTYLKQDKDRKVYRKQIAAKVNQLVQQRFKRWRVQDPAQLELWGFYIDEKLYLGVRLTDDRIRYNYTEPRLRKGALRPSVAAAMAHLIAPSGGETIVDPMCGTGTLIQECIAIQPDARYLCGDSSEEAVQISRQRLAGSAADIACWDALRLPLGDNSVDGFICNLPFGKQYGTDEAIDRLYRNLTTHWIDLLKLSGRMLLMVPDGLPFESVLKRLPCRIELAGKVKLLGTWVRFYRITKENRESFH